MEKRTLKIIIDVETPITHSLPMLNKLMRKQELKERLHGVLVELGLLLSVESITDIEVIEED